MTAPRLGVLIPLRNSIPSSAFPSIVGACSYANAWWKETHGPDAEFHIMTANNVATVAEARLELASKALSAELDWVLWMDDDAVPPVDIAERLYVSGKDIVVPAFGKKMPPYEVTVYYRRGDGWEPVDINPPRLFEVDAAGFHTVLMKGDVLQKMREGIKEPMFVKTPSMGEDVYFCQCAKLLGFSIWCDSRIKVGHVSRYVAWPNGDSNE